MELQFSWKSRNDSVLKNFQDKVSRLEGIILGLENRISVLERNLSPLWHAGAVDMPQQVDAALRDLGEKIKDGQPQFSYFNIRFRSTEAALANIKAIGNELDKRLCKERLIGREAAPPPSQKMKSKLCTQADIESDWAVFWANGIRCPLTYHRKLWEVVYVAQALWSAGKLASGARGLCFGCGTEPLPSLFAKYGTTILGLVAISNG